MGQFLLIKKGAWIVEWLEVVGRREKVSDLYTKYHMCEATLLVQWNLYKTVTLTSHTVVWVKLFNQVFQLCLIFVEICKWVSVVSATVACIPQCLKQFTTVSSLTASQACFTHRMAVRM